MPKNAVFGRFLAIFQGAGTGFLAAVVFNVQLEFFLNHVCPHPIDQKDLLELSPDPFGLQNLCEEPQTGEIVKKRRFWWEKRGFWWI